MKTTFSLDFSTGFDMGTALFLGNRTEVRSIRQGGLELAPDLQYTEGALKNEAARNGVRSADPSLTKNLFWGSSMAGLYDKPRDKREQDRVRATSHSPANDDTDDDCWQPLGLASLAIVERLSRGRPA